MLKILNHVSKVSYVRSSKKNAEEIRSLVVDSSQVCVTKVCTLSMIRTKKNTMLSADHLYVKVLEIFGCLCSETIEDASNNVVSFNILM